MLFEKLYNAVMEEEVERRGLRSEEILEETKEFLLKLRDSLARLYKVTHAKLRFIFSLKLTSKTKPKTINSSPFRIC